VECASRMSDLGPLADENQMPRHFREVPEAAVDWPWP